MKRKLFSIAALLLVTAAQAQVGIGTITPNKSAELTIMSKDKGILIPNIALESTTDRTTIVNGNVESLLVYTNTSQGDIVPGFYYWDQARWVRIVPDVDIANEVINDFVTIIEDETVLLELERVILNTKTSVFFDGTKFEYIDENGEVQLIDISSIVKANETLTTLVNNQDGTFTYTSENGTQVIIDVPQSVIEQFEEIVNNQEVLLLLEQIILNTKGSVFYDGTKFEYITPDGAKQNIDISAIVKANETPTTLVDNRDGTYTYTSEVGTRTVINVPQSVIKQFETIVSNEGVLLQLEQIILNTKTSVFFDGTKFEYIDEDGVKQSVDISTIVKANETQTTLVDNQDGTYTYTSENGNQTVINVPQSVIEQFETIVSNEEVLLQLENIILNTKSSVFFDGNNFEFIDENGVKKLVDITHIVRTHETQTTLVNNQDGTYTYNSENGSQTTINVPQSVIEQFEEIVNQETVLHKLEEIILKTGGNVYFDGTSFEYNDENDVRQVVDIEKIVKENETLTILAYDAATGILTYSDELGNPVEVDVKNAVKSFETVTNVMSDSALGTITFTDEDGIKTILDMKGLVKANETITKLVNHGNGSFTYYSEKAIDSSGSIIPAEGTTFTVPKVEKYDLTRTIRFVDGSSTSQSWNYNDMNFTMGPSSSIYRRSNETYKSVFRAPFSANSNPVTTKYIHVDFTLMASTSNRINNTFGAVQVFTMIDVEIYINGILAKEINEKIYYFGGPTTGWDTAYGDYSAMIALTSDMRLNSSGNTIDIRVKPTRNNFFKNADKSDSGYFLTGNANVFNVELNDNLEINIFEKQ